MAIDRDLLVDKLNSACKKMAIPYVRVQSAEMEDSTCRIESNVGPIEIQYLTDEDTEKDVVHKFLSSSSPIKDCSRVEVTDVEKCKTSNLSLGKLPESFVIEGLPYKQLKIGLGDKSVFIDLCKTSYIKVYNYFYSLYSKAHTVSFEKFSTLIKRKELLVLLLSISK